MNQDTNPFEPPQPQPELRATTEREEESEVEPPRYTGKLTQLEGEIDEEEAIWHAQHSVQIDTSSNPSNPLSTNTSTPHSAGQRRGCSWIILFMLLLAGMSLTFFFNGRTNPTTGTATSLTLFGFAAFLVIPAIALLGIFVWLHRRNTNLRRADPPLGGRAVLRFTELGLSVQKQVGDGRTLELFCSWRQVQVSQSQSETAWILMIGITTPIIFPKEWIQPPEERFAFEQLFFSIAKWQQLQPVILNLASVPAEAAESYPAESSVGIPFEIRGHAEARVRKRLSRQLRGRVPSLDERSWLQSATKLGLLPLIAILPVGLLIFDWSQGNGIRSGWWQLFAPVGLLIGIAVWSRWTNRKDSESNKVLGRIGNNDIWLNYRSILVRQSINNFVNRFRFNESLLLETENQKSVLVLDRSFFDSEADFLRAEDAVVRDDTRS